jgi:PIN domain nuclease of toxin-antitoxin system
VASTWEIVIKESLGKLRLPSPPGHFLAGVLGAQAIQVLPVLQAHALDVHSLPGHHRDPFDRMLAAQARVEGLALISGDAIFSSYTVQVFW